MLNQLVDAIRPSVARLESQLAAAETELVEKRVALNNAIIDSGIDDKAATKLESEVAAVQRRAENLRSALDAARSRHAGEQAEAAKDARRATWQKTVNLAAERHKAIEHLHEAMEVFADAYNEVLRVNSKLFSELPAGHDSIATLTDRFALETLMRKQLVKLDLPWCFIWPYGKADLPDLVPTSEGALNVIRSLVPKDIR